MTILKYDNYIKNSNDIENYFNILRKILYSNTLTQSFIASA